MHRSRHRSSRLLSTVVAVLLCTAGLVALDQRPAEACTCARRPGAAEVAASADAVFVGRLIEFGPRQGPPDDPRVSGTLLVTAAVKGVAVGDRVAVSISVRSEGFCGTDVLRFATPTGFMVQRDPTGSPVQVSLCGQWSADDVADLAAPPTSAATPSPTAPTTVAPRAEPVTAAPSLTG